MSAAQQDPFKDTSWGSLRNSAIVGQLLTRAQEVMVDMAQRFATERPDNPRLTFEPGGDLPVLGRFLTPLGNAEVRLAFNFQASAEAGEADELNCAIQVFVRDVASSDRGWRMLDWRINVFQYGPDIAVCGGFERELSGAPNGHRVQMNRFQAGMALYRAIAEQK